MHYFKIRSTSSVLGLTIIDEQQRFGVHQRMLLRDKGNLPHQLIMTATPIPRTLALYLFADMDVSRITELPPGRQSITTTLHSEKHRVEVIEAVRRHVERGQQAYWVCAAIAESENDEQELIGTEDVLKELAQKNTRCPCRPCSRSDESTRKTFSNE